MVVKFIFQAVEDKIEDEMVNIVFMHNTHKLLEIKSKKSYDKVKYLYRQICFLFCLPLLRVIKHVYFCFRFRNAFWYNESRPLRWPNWLKWSLHYLLTTFFFLFAYDLKKKNIFSKGSPYTDMVEMDAIFLLLPLFRVVQMIHKFKIILSGI